MMETILPNESLATGLTGPHNLISPIRVKFPGWHPRYAVSDKKVQALMQFAP